MIRTKQALLLSCLVGAWLPAQDVTPGDRWPAFRGTGSGHTAAKDLPRTWSPDAGVAWKTTLPGIGQSSPVAWGDRVFVTGISGAMKELLLVTCYRTGDGQTLWTRSFPATVKAELSRMVSQGAPTPVADGERIYAGFESGDLIALDHEGAVVWRRALSKDFGGAYQGNHGFGSSLALAPTGIVALFDHDGPSVLLCLDPATGKTRWKTERKSRVSWSSPMVAPLGESPEIVVSSNGTVDGYDAGTGALRWSIDGIVGNTVPSPAVLRDRVIVGASKGTSLAVRRPRTEGGVAERLWEAEKGRPLGFASPLVIDGNVLLLNKAGALSCHDLETGALRWRERLAEGAWASPVASGGVVWSFGKTGKTTVFRPTAAGLEILGTNELPTEGTVYGVAALDGAFFVREAETLFCLRKPAPAPEDAPAKEPRRGR